MIVWLPHLLPDPTPELDEVARALKAGGVLVTTVDKNDAYFVEDNNIAQITAELRRRHAPLVPDHSDSVLDSAAGQAAVPASGVAHSVNAFGNCAAVRRSTDEPAPLPR
ncbi:hypothetical protein ACWDKQ_33840 [Saccharopolyspora sp. NPDC000995]